MKTMTLKEFLACTGGQLLSEKENVFSDIGFDTRLDLTGKIFIAIHGETHDAHDFIAKAVEKGAAAVVVHRETADLADVKSRTTVIKVPDTLLALHDLARYSRRNSKALVVGIAGSNGKTTSKEFCAAVISTYRKVHYSKGSFNNHWGVPFTILSEAKDTQVLILEMGMNHPRELEVLAKIGEPDIAVVTYVGVEHIEHFGSLEKISEAEEEIYKFSPPQAQRIFNLDNPWTNKMFARATQDYPNAKKIWTFSAKNKNADVSLEIVELTMGSLRVRGHIGAVKNEAVVAIFGAHNLTNLMVAAAVGLSVGLSGEEVWAALPNCKSTWGRNQLVTTKHGAQILFDGYNANPDSMTALLENLSLLKTSGKRFGVFGQMRELGHHAAAAHLELGTAVGKASFDCIWFVGEDCDSFESGIKASGYSKQLMISSRYDGAFASQLAAQLTSGDLAIVKGSRGVELERFVLACEPLNFNGK